MSGAFLNDYTEFDYEDGYPFGAYVIHIFENTDSVDLVLDVASSEKQVSQSLHPRLDVIVNIWEQILKGKPETWNLATWQAYDVHRMVINEKIGKFSNDDIFYSFLYLCRRIAGTMHVNPMTKHNIEQIIN